MIIDKTQSWQLACRGALTECGGVGGGWWVGIRLGILFFLALHFISSSHATSELLTVARNVIPEK